MLTMGLYFSSLGLNLDLDSGPWALNPGDLKKEKQGIFSDRITGQVNLKNLFCKK